MNTIGSTMESVWEYDEYSFELTARVLLKINPHVSKRFSNEAQFVDWMKSESLRMCDAYTPHPELASDKLTHWGIYGFCISMSHRKNGGGYAQANLNPFIVCQALNIPTE